MTVRGHIRSFWAYPIYPLFSFFTTCLHRLCTSAGGRSPQGATLGSRVGIYQGLAITGDFKNASSKPLREDAEFGVKRYPGARPTLDLGLYTPFRSDDAKELVRQTTEEMIYIHGRCWKSVSDEGTRGNITGRICAGRNRLHWRWAVVSHSMGLHSSPAQPRPVTWPHRRASTYPLVAYELHSADRIRPLRSAREL